MEVVDYLNSSSDAQIDLINMMIMHEDNKQTQFQAGPEFAFTLARESSSSSSSPTTTPSVPQQTSVEAMREMIFSIAAMQPIHIDPEAVKPPKRRNVKISTDPQSVAARHRRERISERIRILQRMVPGGTKMDTASMLDEAIHYMKFLKTQVQSLERAAAVNSGHNLYDTAAAGGGDGYFPASVTGFSGGKVMQCEGFGNGEGYFSMNSNSHMLSN